MAIATVDECSQFVPNTTLGRNGRLSDSVDILRSRANQLDALLCFITVGFEEDGDLSRLNDEIQRTLLELAGDLATEVNERLTASLVLERPSRTDTGR